MMRLKQVFGPSIPMSEARVWRQVNSPRFLIYMTVFAVVAAIWHPHAGLKSAPLLAQVVFWGIAFPLFTVTYLFIHLTMIRVSLRFGIVTIWETLIMFLTTAFMVGPILVLFPVLGVSTGGARALAEMVVFCFALFEIGAFGYLAFGDKVLFPEIYASPDAKADDPTAHEIFLRGTPLPVAQVEMIRSVDDGFEAYGMGQTHIGKRRFGLVLSELPVDLGFQIHRSIWISRKLAEHRQRDGRNVFVTLSNGKRLPVARSRQTEFENWMKLLEGRKTGRPS